MRYIIESGFFRKGNTNYVHVTCTIRTCGLSELNSRFTTVYINENGVTSCLFQWGENKEGRESTVTEER